MSKKRDQKKHSGKKKKTGVLVEGILDFTQHGSAYLITDDQREDIYISKKKLKKAFNGDRVKAEIIERRDRKKPEGEVISIVKRAKDVFVGTLDINGTIAFIRTKRTEIPVDVFVAKFDKKMGGQGDLVKFEIIDWPDSHKRPFGKVLQNLGLPGENEAEINSILIAKGLPTSFPNEVEAAADKIPETIPEEEIAKRKDLRKVTTFTIDPEDAKDFDDALSFEKLDDETFVIGVHIADVSHYVTPGSILDKEAVKRATSIYLVDRVVPMLPEKLSNGLCSLRPNEDKLCFSVLFTMNNEGIVLDQWFGKTVIHSDKRFSYEDAQEQIEGIGEDIFRYEIQKTNELSHILRKKRFAEGSLAFETSEVKFILDEKKKPIGLKVKVRKDAHLMIEDFMLLANKAVATKALDYKKNNVNLPFVYRVHDNPDPEKLRDFKKFAATFGHKLNIENPKQLSASINTLTQSIRGTAEQDILEKLLIRCMSKAIYTTENIGHYGLAFDNYSHFTSPIRRYPDVMTHRLLFQYLNKDFGVDRARIQELCNHSSAMERKAMEAERESVKFKQVEYMETAVGKTFDGIISGIMHFGVFVEMVDTLCEGMIPIKNLPEDEYMLQPQNHMLVGNFSGRKFRFGDKVKVKVAMVSLEKKQIDLKYICHRDEIEQ